MYELPQEGASELANQKILEFHEKYGSYFLYDFTPKDALYKLANTAGTSVRTVVTPARAEYVEDMLFLLEQAWLQHLPAALVKEKVPLRVFLADTLCYYDGTRPMGMQYYGDMKTMTVENSMIMGGVNATLPSRLNEVAWAAKVMEYTKLLFPNPLTPETMPEFWALSAYGTWQEEKTWQGGSGSGAGYVPGGAYYESVLPGGLDWLRTGSGNWTQSYVPYGTTEQVSVTYSQDQVKKDINILMAGLGYVPQFQAAALSNPAIYATPFMPQNPTMNWTKANLQGYELTQWSAWIWATDQQINDSGWFDGTYPILKQKFDMYVAAYREAGLDIRKAANEAAR
jgi:hypothetical protein